MIFKRVFNIILHFTLYLMMTGNMIAVPYTHPIASIHGTETLFDPITALQKLTQSLLWVDIK